MTDPDTGRLIESLVKRGRQRGFLTTAEVQQELEVAKASGESFDMVIVALRKRNIEINEESEDLEEDLIGVEEVGVSDPVRMYLNEIGRVRLLTTQQEV